MLILLSITTVVVGHWMSTHGSISSTDIIGTSLNASFFVLTGSLGIHTVRLTQRNVYSRSLFIAIMVMNILGFVGSIMADILLERDIVELSKMAYYNDYNRDRNVIDAVLLAISLMTDLILAVLAIVATHIARKNVDLLKASCRHH